MMVFHDKVKIGPGLSFRRFNVYLVFCREGFKVHFPH